MRKLWTNRKAVSSMIGGIIILTLFLSALSVMVFISQQYDTYQSTVENMNHNDISAFSENLVPVYPGIYYYSNQTFTTQGACNAGCYQYALYVSNEAAIGTQVTRIYINSTDSRNWIPGASGQSIGCGNLCEFDPASTPEPFHFLASSAFVNPSEYAHQLTFYTNSTYTLPCSTTCGAYGVNSIAIVTTRGRVFSFQWPIPPTGISTVSYLTTGVMQIAYQQSLSGGYSSSNEPAAGGSGSGYCHSELDAHKYTGSAYGTLWFVDPWVNNIIFNDAFPLTQSNHTIFFLAVNVTNNQKHSIAITRGNVWLQLIQGPYTQGTKAYAVSLVLGGPMIGTYYDGVFTQAGSTTTVLANDNVVLIYKIIDWNWWGGINDASWLTSLPTSVTYSGMATMTNDQKGGSPAYFSGTTVLDGLYVRAGC